MNGIKIRWLNAQCYEIILPNGKHIITDPYLTAPNVRLDGYRKFSINEIERIDYIMVTHSHYDHTSDIGYLCERYQAKLFIGDMTAAMTAEYFDMDYALLYPMSHMQTFEMEDFTMTAMKGKHFISPSKRERGFNVTRLKQGIMGYGELDVLGVVENFNFCLTFNNNIRLMFLSGEDEFGTVYSIAKEFRPNVVIRQPKASWGIDKYADILDRFGAQIALPNHQDSIINGKFPYTLKEFEMMTREELEKRHSVTTFICPEPYQWYTIGMGVCLEGKLYEN